MTSCVKIRFHGNLNELLPRAWQQQTFDFDARKPRSAKDLIESIGVPHTEVDIVLVNARSERLEFLIEGGEQIEVYPARCQPDLVGLIHNLPELSGEPRLLLDVHLGKLAGYLRLLGFDTLYRNDYDDAELADLSHHQRRILVSCDRKLLMRSKVEYGYLMRSRSAPEQVRELFQRYDLANHRTGQVRCMRCNGLIKAVEKKKIESRLLPLTKKYYQDFYQCSECGQIYWQGSHYARIAQLAANMVPDNCN